MKWLVLALLAAGCASQDAALDVTVEGGFRIPQDADKLSIYVYDGTAQIKRMDWCATATSDCPALPPQAALVETLTIVESGGNHPHVKLNAELRQGALVVGLGSVTADFSGGTTVPVELTLTRQSP
jgi:hypothetical protein